MLEKEKKKELVSNLVESVRQEIIKLIDNGKIPEEWNGHELRQLIADKFNYEKTQVMKGNRLKDYKNTVYLNNL